jgi:hypothetical protein
MALETIVRPFQSPGVEPVPFAMPGQQGSALVELKVKGNGSSSSANKVSWTGNVTATAYMARAHRETPNITQVHPSAVSETQAIVATESA